MNNTILGEMRLDKNKRIFLGNGTCKECGGKTKITAPYIPPQGKLFYFSKRHQCVGICKKLWLFEEDKIKTEATKECEYLDKQFKNKMLLDD